MEKFLYYAHRHCLIFVVYYGVARNQRRVLLIQH